MRIVAPIPKTILLVRQNLSKTNLFLRGNFTPFMRKKYSNLRPLLSISFAQRFRKYNKFGHCTKGSGSKKTFKWSEQRKKNP